jgi:hypothetical protein
MYDWLIYWRDRLEKAGNPLEYKTLTGLNEPPPEEFEETGGVGECSEGGAKASPFVLGAV